MKNTLEDINSRLDAAQDWISVSEDKVVENNQNRKQKQKPRKEKWV